jgi:hypothetical protein
MMFERNLKKREGSRCLDDEFGGCSTGICRFDKKIEPGKKLDFLEK